MVQSWPGNTYLFPKKEKKIGLRIASLFGPTPPCAMRPNFFLISNKPYEFVRYLITIPTGSPSFYCQFHGQTIHPIENFISMTLFKIPGSLAWS